MGAGRPDIFPRIDIEGYALRMEGTCLRVRVEDLQRHIEMSCKEHVGKLQGSLNQRQASDRDLQCEARRFFALVLE
jgi:hypothetical protein